jgi:SAM-dependent methyltransferase
MLSRVLATIKKVPRGLVSYLTQAARVIPAYLALRRASNPRFSLRLQDLLLCLDDATDLTRFDRHYVFHTAWASRILARTRPQIHTDISSSLYFVTSASAFVPIRFFDFRPVNMQLSGLTSEAADLCLLPFADGSIDSLSCMHVVEHVGLGRYGDSIDYDGDLKAVSELQRVLAQGGQLLFVVPIGAKARIQFNAHRIYTHRQVIDMFSSLSLKQFAMIPDLAQDGGLVISPDKALIERQKYACGCFWFVKNGPIDPGCRGG